MYRRLQFRWPCDCTTMHACLHLYHLQEVQVITCCYAFLNCFAVCLQLRRSAGTLRLCRGFREAYGEPGSRTCSWAPMASPRRHSPSSITLRKSTKVKLAPSFFHCSPYAGKYITLKMLEEQCPMSFSAGNLSSIVAAKFLGSWFLFHLYLLYRVFCFCFSRNTIPFLWGKRKRNIVLVIIQCSLKDWNIEGS